MFSGLQTNAGTLLIAAAIGLAITLGLFWRAWYESRRGQFYYTREQAARRARNLGLFVVLPLMAVVVALFIHWLDNRQRPEPSATATPSVDLTTSLAPSTPTPAPPAETPTLRPTPTASPSPTATAAAETPSPTPSPTGVTPDLLLPTALLTPPPEGAVMPNPDANFGPITLAAGIDDDKQPLDIGSIFPVGTQRVYAFFEFHNMAPGTPWTQAWYWNRREAGSETTLWEYSSQGHSWIFFGPRLGYEAGVWEVRLYIGQLLQAQASFEVK